MLPPRSSSQNHGSAFLPEWSLRKIPAGSKRQRGPPISVLVDAGNAAPKEPKAATD